MNFFEKIIFALQFEAERPGNYGWFHIMFILIAIVSTCLLCIYARKVKDKTFRLIILISWGILVLFEVYKQLVFSFNNESVTWSLDWGSFPFQLCSTPLYVLPFITLLKDCKVRDGAMMFISTFSFFGGLCVYVFPNDVFATDYLGVQIQTMVHHGLQVVLGIYIAVYNRKKFTLKNFVLGVIWFAGLLFIALSLNLIMKPILVDKTFNMFYIGPHYDCTLPLLSMIYPAVPYIVFFLIYSLGFVLCAFIMRNLIYGGMLLADKIGQKLKKND